MRSSSSHAIALGVALVSAVAIHSSATPRELPPGIWTMIPANNVVLLGKLSDPRLAEASGIAPSKAKPGLFWTIDD